MSWHLGPLREMAKRDPKEVFDSLHRQPLSLEINVNAAEHLFLQRLAHSGKAVLIKNGKWISPGFNATSAYGKRATERFGEIKPMIPSLIRVLEGYDEQLRVEHFSSLIRSAYFPSRHVEARTLVYIDPPYAGTTQYGAESLTRQDVILLALGWRAMGASVIVSEAEALATLLDEGWSAKRISSGRNDTSPFRGQQEEWLTFCS